jgi:hypothetical protein
VAQEKPDLGKKWEGHLKESRKRYIRIVQNIPRGGRIKNRKKIRSPKF